MTVCCEREHSQTKAIPKNQLDAPWSFAAPLPASIAAMPGGEFEKFLRIIDRKDVVTVTCIDYREHDREGYLLTSAGNIPHSHLMNDLHLILAGKQALILRSHTDCAKSKAETFKHPGESDELYRDRVEMRTLERMWDSARILLSDPSIQNAIRGGMRFCMCLNALNLNYTHYFEKHSAALVEEIVYGGAPERMAA